MIKEEILAMRTGRDLNLLVCEKVFDNKTFGSVRPYSTDISDAWQVVVVAYEKERLHLKIEPVRPRGYIVSFMWMHDEGGWTEAGSAYCDTLEEMPEAICKAALLATLQERRR